MKTIRFLFLVMSFPLCGQAQVGINSDGSSPHPSAMLDVESTSKGLLIPRMTTTQRDNISDPEQGLILFNSTLKKYQGCVMYYDTVIDQQQVNANTPGTPNIPYGQSVSVSQAGRLVKISVGCEYCIGGELLEIFNGTTCDPDRLLYSQSYGCTNQFIINPPLEVLAQQDLTFLITPYDIYGFVYWNGDVYPAGAMHTGYDCARQSLKDLNFSISLEVEDPQWVDLSP